MAATKEQGASLATLLIGFTALPAGLVVEPTHPAVGVVVAVIGGALMIISLVQMFRIKPMEFMEDEGGK